MTDTEQTFELDRKHRAIRSGEKWALQQRKPDGTHDTLRTWQGGRRSLIQTLEEFHIVPSREAEALLGTIPESSGFRER